MEKETLEEAAEKLTKDFPHYSVRENMSDPEIKEWFLEALQIGAELQDERMYSEEDLREAYFSAIKSTGEGRNGEYTGGNDPNIEEAFKEEFETWKEQFKKK